MTREEWNHKALRLLVKVAYCWLRTNNSPLLVKEAENLLVKEAQDLLKENK